MKNSYFNKNPIQDLLNEIKFVYQFDNRPWIIGYSGGKDSTTGNTGCTQFFLGKCDWTSIHIPRMNGTL